MPANSMAVMFPLASRMMRACAGDCESRSAKLTDSRERRRASSAGRGGAEKRNLPASSKTVRLCLFGPSYSPISCFHGAGASAGACDLARACEYATDVAAIRMKTSAAKGTRSAACLARRLRTPGFLFHGEAIHAFAIDRKAEARSGWHANRAFAGDFDRRIDDVVFPLAPACRDIPRQGVAGQG